MGQVLHGSATTTEAVRRAIQHSQESLSTLVGLVCTENLNTGIVVVKSAQDNA